MRTFPLVLALSAAVVVSAGAQTFPSSRGRWSRTANDLAASHNNRLGQITLLADGRVAVSGGNTAIELFDPVTNTFSAGPTDLVSRFSFTATLLQDGRVLFAGGSNGLASCSIYSPAAGTVTATGSLITGRRRHTATLLPNGKVLVCGGMGPNFTPTTPFGPTLPSCELYDPASGTWTAAGNMTRTRDQHTAALLSNGKVLIDGGNSTSQNVEVYDPATMTSTTAGGQTSRPFGFAGNATVAADGRVVLSGDSTTQRTVDIYDPVTNTVAPAPALVEETAAHVRAARLPDGRILLAGGSSSARTLTFDPATTRSSVQNELPNADELLMVRLNDGRILATGGTRGYLYDPAARGVPRGDFNGDRRADILWHNPGTRETIIWSMNGLVASGSDYLPKFNGPTAGQSWRLEALLDMDGGGVMDVLWRELTQPPNAMRYTLGPAATGPASFAFGSHELDWSVVAAADVNGNGREDIIWRNSNGDVVITLGKHSTDAEPIVSQYIGTISEPGWIIAAADDFDGDGMADVFWRHAGRGENYIWFMNGFTVERAGHTVPVADPNYEIAGTGDFDGDGKADLVWRNETAGLTVLWLMNGVSPNGSGISSPPSGWRVGLVGDFNGDGKSDIFWRNLSTGGTAASLIDGFTVLASSSLPSVTTPGWTTPKY